jgi:hypothetical protein
VVSLRETCCLLLEKRSNDPTSFTKNDKKVRLSAAFFLT